MFSLASRVKEVIDILVAIDIDGSADSDPPVFQSLMAALMAAGHQVVILTGCSSPTPTKQDKEKKAAYLQSIGLGKCYNQLVVFGDPPHKAKAKWCKKNNVDLLIDNSVQNAKLASKYCLVFVPWNTLQD